MSHSRLAPVFVSPDFSDISSQKLEISEDGMYKFRFCEDGLFKTVVIDDELPFTSDGKKLKFAYSLDKNEMWIALIEKAYAKLCGSYAAMQQDAHKRSVYSFCPLGFSQRTIHQVSLFF
jgi:hypothetical protein